jgi:predicted acylesterase/phospholipase RssA
MTRRYAHTAAALLAASLLVAFLVAFLVPFSATPAAAQNAGTVTTPAAAHRNTRAKVKTAPAAATQPRQLPPRIPFTAAEAAAAAIANMPDARFWADSVPDFTAALPQQPGPWLALSSGGADGAFGAGLLTGLSAAGKRPDYAVVTGVSTGALMAPFVFAGPRYDDALRAAYTKVSAADIFEVGGTGESFVDSWPLKDLIAKQITPALLADVAAAHRGGRRLFIVTTNLDAERSVVWNMGAIAAHAADKNGGDAALNLFRTVLLASSAIPGGFPPVLIDVDADGKRFQEMHVDGGVGGQFFVGPAAVMAATADYRLPATALYVVINSGLQPDFQVVDRSTPSILTKTVGAAVKVDTRLMIDRAYLAAKRLGIEFNVASIPADFNVKSRGPFDPGYMSALFQAGYDMGKSATPFGNMPPPYPGRPAAQSPDMDKTGANR